MPIRRQWLMAACAAIDYRQEQGGGSAGAGALAGEHVHAWAQGHGAQPAQSHGHAGVCPSPPPRGGTGAATLTAPGAQVRFCVGIWNMRTTTALRKPWRTPMTKRLSSSRGKAEGDESWGMMLPPTSCTTPCQERGHGCYIDPSKPRSSRGRVWGL